MAAEGRGMISICLFYVQIAILFNDVIGGSTLANLIPKYGLKKLAPAAWLCTAIITVILLSVSYFIFLPPISSSFVAWLFIPTAFIGFSYSAFQGLNQINHRNYLQVILEASRLIGVMVLFYLFNDTQLNNVLWMFVISGVIASIWAANKLSKHLILKWYPIPAEVIKMGFSSQIGHLLNFLNYKIAIFFIYYLLSSAEAGIFANALLAADTIWLLANSFGTVAHAKFLQRNRTQYLIKLTLYHMNWSLIGTLICCAIMVIVPNSWYISVFGSDFNTLKWICMLLIPGIIFFSLSTQIGHLLHAINKFSIINIGNFLALIVQILGIAILAPRLEMYGVVWAFNSAFFVNFLWLWYQFKKL